MPTTEREPGAGLYVHLPFCGRICPYCDFAVHRHDADLERRLQSALRTEVERLGRGHEGAIETIYLGGGTPSLTAPADLERLLGAVDTAFEVEPGRELVLEANPEDVDAPAVSAWRELGVTTLSLGVQSFDAAALRFLGRLHEPAEARRAVELALDGGFATVSVDLIYARPGQSLAAWRRELDTLAALAPDHVSCYQLTLHRSTPFGRAAARGRLTAMPDDEQAELFLSTHRRLAELGWEAYEVSNFARRPEHRSRHNSRYWTGGSYLGAGPSAHSFVAPERWWNVPRVTDYLERIESGAATVAGRETLSVEQSLLEAVMLGLRTVEGVDLARLGERFAVDLLAANRDLLDHWSGEGTVRLEGGRVLPTPRGWLLADRLAADLDISSNRAPGTATPSRR